MKRHLLAALLAVPFLLMGAEDPFYQGPSGLEPEYGFCAASQPHGIFYPGEEAVISLVVPDKPKATAEGGVIRMVAVHSRQQTPGEIGFFNNFAKSRLVGTPAQDIRLDLTGAKNGVVQVRLPLPETFGTYALELVRADGSRTYLGQVLRVLKPTPRKGDIPHLMSGKDWDIGVPALQERLGVTLIRTELHWGQDYKAEHDILEYAKHGIKVMVTTGIHPENKRPFRLGGVCGPESDEEFGRWVEGFVAKYWTGGKTGLWGIENFNEPWEPNGISGWGNDSQRYRAIMKTLYTSAKKSAKDIYILGTSSIMNTEDKLLSEGDESPMMQYVDILTDHYVQPKGAYGGRMAIKWKKLTGETETWGGGSEVLYHHFMTQFLATGNSFLSPVQFQHFAGAAWTGKNANGGEERFYTASTVGVAMATWNALVQDRPFKGIAFADHLPFLYQFGEDDDAQLVLVGRLMALQTARERDVVWPQHAFSPDGSIVIADPKREIEVRDCAGNPQARRADGSYVLELGPTPWFVRSANAKTAIDAVRSGTMTGLRMVEILPGTLATMPTPDAPAPLPVRLHNLRNVAINGELTVATLAQQQPFSTTVPFQMDAGATVTLPVLIAARCEGGVPLRFTATFKGGIVETWDEVVPFTGVTRTPINGIDDPAWSKVPSVLTLRPEGAAAGNEIDKIWKPFLFSDLKQDKLPATRAELQIAWDDSGLSIRGSIEANELGQRPRLETRDDSAYFYGKQDDAILLAMEPWQSFFVPYFKRGIEPSQWVPTTHPQTKAEWEAFDKASKDPQWPAFVEFIEKNPMAKEFVKSGLASSYFAARAKDPSVSMQAAGHVYRPGRDFISELPFFGDSFQVGIDFDRADERFSRLHDLPQLPWRLPDGFTAVPDTDHEFSAYLCNDGKPELWCLLAPGVPRYHYYPHHTRGPIGQAAVKDGAVAVKRIGNRNVYFMHLTWSRLGFTAPPKPGQDFGLMCKWNANGGIEFGSSYAATKSNGLTLHPYWYAPPSNTVRWTLQP